MLGSWRSLVQDRTGLGWREAEACITQDEARPSCRGQEQEHVPATPITHSPEVTVPRGRGSENAVPAAHGFHERYAISVCLFPRPVGEEAYNHAI